MPSPLITGAATLALLLAQPAQAHGIAHGGLAAGFLPPSAVSPPPSGLLGVGAAASCISSQLRRRHLPLAWTRRLALLLASSGGVAAWSLPG